MAAQIFILCCIAGIPHLYVHTRMKTHQTFVPGGHFEASDGDVLHTACREAEEETAFTPPLSRLYQSWQGEGRIGGRYQLHDFTTVIHSSLISRIKIAEPSKHRNGRWLTLKELDRMPSHDIFDDNLATRFRAALVVANDQSLWDEPVRTSQYDHMELRRRFRLWRSYAQCKSTLYPLTSNTGRQWMGRGRAATIEQATYDTALRFDPSLSTARRAVPRMGRGAPTRVESASVLNLWSAVGVRGEWRLTC